MKKILKNYGFIIMMLTGVIAGCIVGAIFPMIKDGETVLNPGATVLEPLGTVFINLMFCIVVPMVFCSIASAIAKIIRQSSGGLACVKALGVMLEDRNIAQVSINMTNLHKTPLYRVVELVKAEAKRCGVTVVGTEVVGLTPMHALIDAAEYYLQIENFDGEKQVLENYLL